MVVFVVALVLGCSYFGIQKSGNIFFGPESTQDNTPVSWVELDVSIDKVEGDWTQDENDVIHYNGMFQYSVTNSGNADTSVSIEITRSGSSLPDYINRVTLLKQSTVTDSLDFDFTGTEIRSQYSVNVESEEAQDFSSFNIEVDFPRVITNKYEPMFVTTEINALLNLKESITKNPIIPDWIELREWVGNNIEYEFDKDQFNQPEYWQFPLETISSKKGDCEDVAILLCTLLRIDGWESSDVFVVAGETSNGDGHAWVVLKIVSIGGRDVWISLEPTAGGWIESSFADLFSTWDYMNQDSTIWFGFNDNQFFND